MNRGYQNLDVPPSYLHQCNIHQYPLAGCGLVSCPEAPKKGDDDKFDPVRPRIPGSRLAYQQVSKAQ